MVANREHQYARNETGATKRPFGDEPGRVAKPRRSCCSLEPEELAPHAGANCLAACPPAKPDFVWPQTVFGTWLRNTTRMNLWLKSAVGSNMSGHPPSITVTPCSRPYAVAVADTLPAPG